MIIIIKYWVWNNIISNNVILIPIRSNMGTGKGINKQRTKWVMGKNWMVVYGVNLINGRVDQCLNAKAKLIILIKWEMASNNFWINMKVKLKYIKQKSFRWENWNNISMNHRYSLIQVWKMYWVKTQHHQHKENLLW